MKKESLKLLEEYPFLGKLKECNYHQIKHNFDRYFEDLKKGSKKERYKHNLKKIYESQIQDLYWLQDYLKELELDNDDNNKLIGKIKNKIFKLIDKKVNYISDTQTIKKDEIVSYDKDLILKVSDVSKYYSNKSMAVRILNNINIEIYKGDFVVVLGPSGSGKTTLMNLISGMDKPTTGKVWVNGYCLDSMNMHDLTLFRKNNIGYVFQRYGLLPNLTVFENVLIGNYLNKPSYNIFDNQIYKKTSYTKAEIKKIKEQNKIENRKNSKETEKEIYNILDLLELKEFADKYPYELSGGQKQRTSIARTIAKKPSIIYGDEPTGAVDSSMSGKIIEAFNKINKELDTTVVIITHDKSIAKYANKVIFLLDGYVDKIINKDKGKSLDDENKKN